MNITILYEDTDVVVIEKPAGIVVHPDGVSKDETISDWMGNTYPQSKDVGEVMVLKNGEEIRRPGVVHRLDKETSGVLILAKTKEAHALLKEQFQKRTVQKHYLAIVYGVPKNKTGVIDVPIGRSANNFRLWSAQRGARGTLREAITEYQVLADDGEFAVLRLSPKTGRTHQLRVHMKYANYPIVCDKLYAPKRPCAFNLQRTALHAHSLTIQIPSGEQKTFLANIPEDLLTAFNSFKNLPL